MNPFKFNFIVAGALAAAPSLVSAHPGSHGASSWHHYLTSPEHAALLVVFVLIGLGCSIYLSRNSTSTRTGVKRR